MTKCLGRQARLDAWQKAFRVKAPRYAQESLLNLALNWHQQMQQNALRKGQSGQKRLNKLLACKKQRLNLTPGTYLIRTFQQKRYSVLVLPQGFLLNGQTFKSLSAVARHITGTTWSGRTFFGIKS